MKAGRKARFLLADIKYTLARMKMSPKMRGELDRLHSFLRQNGNSLPAIDRVALLLRQRSFPLDHALKAYENYLAQQPDSANAAFNYAWNLARDGQFETAIQWYRRALELGIDQPEEVLLNIANIYMGPLRDDAKAQEELQWDLDYLTQLWTERELVQVLPGRVEHRDAAGRQIHAACEVEEGREVDPSVGMSEHVPGARFLPLRDGQRFQELAPGEVEAQLFAFEEGR